MDIFYCVVIDAWRSKFGCPVLYLRAKRIPSSPIYPYGGNTTSLIERCILPAFRYARLDSLALKTNAVDIRCRGSQGSYDRG